MVVAGHPECGDQRAFYVGAVGKPHDSSTGEVGRFTMRFYDNPKQDLYGTFKPAWSDTKFARSVTGKEKTLSVMYPCSHGLR